jgi:hypothetical protein
MARAVSVMVFAPLVAVTTPVGGQTPVDQCVDAHTQAQSLLRAEKLGAARDALEACVDAACPSLVRDDCAQLLADLERAQPKIVFDARDEDGHDLSEVNVLMDGRPFIDRLEGIAIRVDPGPHVFTFEAQGRPAVTKRFIIKEGDRDRRELVILTAVAGSLPDGSASPPAFARTGPPLAGAQPALGSQRVLALVLAGVGLVGLGTAGAFAIVANAKKDDANALCHDRTCPNREAVAMSHDAVVAGNVATVAVSAGAATIAASAVLWFVARPSSKKVGTRVGLGLGSILVEETW